MKKTITIAILGLAIIVSNVQAQQKAGRTGATFLEVGVGAREAALGAAVTSLALDANQIFWNPAGTALKEDQIFSANFSYNEWIGDLSYSAASAGYHFDGIGTLTFGVQVFGLSDIKANRQNGYADPILQSLVTDNKTSSTFDYMDLAFSLSYSRYIVNNLALGTTVKYINQRIDNVSGDAFAFDFGSVYHVGIAGWQLAARLSNLGTPITFYNQDNPLPLTFAIGTSIYPVSNESMRLMLAADATKPLDSEQLIYAGTELSFYDLIFFRGGYKFNYSGKKDDGTSEREQIKTTIEGVSLGAGLQLIVSEYNVAVDYAFTKMDLLNNAHRISLKIGM